MKRLTIIFAFVLAFSARMHAQEFTGIMQLEMENFETGEVASITCYLKFPYCKMQVNSTAKEGSSSYTLYFDNQKPEVIMVAGGTRTAVPVAGLPVNKYLENILVAIPTGRTQQTAGYNSTEVNIKSTNAVIQCWVATELEANFPSVLNNRGIVKALKESNIKGIPLTMEVKDLSGKPVLSQRIISVSPQSLDDSMFNAN